jgi:hypothetical protein
MRPSGPGVGVGKGVNWATGAANDGITVLNTNAANPIRLKAHPKCYQIFARTIAPVIANIFAKELANFITRHSVIIL